ncbi:hypothetical protein LCGC14_0164610 [marine sediment metagenome]|uniref:Uncharacterized protein n=1 Tax=marine sediment metagenome TaxID=412755 RepID=A0A0F9VAP8_9ZZZZ
MPDLLSSDDWEKRLFGDYRRQWWAGAEVYRMGSTLDEPVLEADQAALDAWREKVTDPQAIKAFEDEYLCTRPRQDEARQQAKTKLFRAAYGKSSLTDATKVWMQAEMLRKERQADSGTTSPENVSGVVTTKFTSATQGKVDVVDGSNDVHVSTHDGATQCTFTVEIPGVDQWIVDEYRRNLKTLRDIYGDQISDVVLPEQTEEALREFNENFRRHASSLYSSPEVVKTTDLLGMLLLDTLGTLATGVSVNYWSLQRYTLKDLGEERQALGIPVGCAAQGRNIVIRKAGKNYPHVNGHEWHIDHTECSASLISPAFPTYERANAVAEQLINNCQWGLSGYEPGEVFNNFPAHMGEYMQYMTRRDVDFVDYQTWLLRFHR